MKRKSLILFLGILMILATLFFPQQRYTLVIREGMPAVMMAIPNFIAQGSSPEIKAAAAMLHDVFSADMAYSRVFQPLPSTYYSYIRPLDPANIHFKDWESISAKLLMIGEVREGDDGQILFDATAYDVRSERYIFPTKRYTFEKELTRLAAHRISNEMMRLYGEPDIFTTKIVFVSNRDGNDEIYMMDYDGHNQTRLTFNKVKDYMPVWAPDSEQFAYTSYRFTRAPLFIFNPFKGDHRQVQGGGTNWAPSFSPDGKKLAYCSTVTVGNAEIYVANSDGSNSRRLTFNPAADTAPTWSPTGRQIAFTSDRGGSPQIYTMDAEGTNVKKITFGGGNYHDAPAWSPNGEFIAYVSRVEQIFDIYVLNLRTEQIFKLTESNAKNEYPTWSPDNRHIIFTSDKTGKTQIYSIDYDGSNVRRLTSAGENKLPDWSRK